jgi:methylsterol monooxygenase
MPALAYWLMYDVYSDFGMKTDLASWAGTSWSTALRDLFVCIAVNDTGFYWGHRVLHWGPLYTHIHKKHHEYKAPTSEASEWAHPIEDLFVNIAPTVLGGLVMGSHLYTFAFWLTLRMWKTCDAHSGYLLPFPLSIFHGLPGLLGADMHDFHHETTTGGCYGTFTTFWDRICGTDQAFYARQAAATTATKKAR